jgi:hypothetical protein
MARDRSVARAKDRAWDGNLARDITLAKADAPDPARNPGQPAERPGGPKATGGSGPVRERPGLGAVCGADCPEKRKGPPGAAMAGGRPFQV